MEAIPYNYKLIEMNEKRFGSNDGSHCIICSKPVNVEKHKLWVRIVEGGNYIGTDAEAKANPAGDVGCYPIGKDCLKHHPQLLPYVNEAIE